MKWSVTVVKCHRKVFKAWWKLVQNRKDGSWWQVLKVLLFMALGENDSHEAVQSSPMVENQDIDAWTSSLCSSSQSFELNLQCVFCTESIDEEFYAKEKKNLKKNVVRYTLCAI